MLFPVFDALQETKDGLPKKYICECGGILPLRTSLPCCFRWSWCCCRLAWCLLTSWGGWCVLPSPQWDGLVLPANPPPDPEPRLTASIWRWENSLTTNGGGSFSSNRKTYRRHRRRPGHMEWASLQSKGEPYFLWLRLWPRWSHSLCLIWRATVRDRYSFSWELFEELNWI